MILTFFVLLVFFSVLSFVLTLNPIESLLWLMLTLALLAFLLFFIHLDFFAVTLIILYVSAVTVLFVYIILMVPFVVAKSSYNIFFIFSIVLFFFLICAVSAHFFCDFPKYSTGLIKLLFVENNFLFFSDFFLNQINLIGFFLYTKGLINFVILTIIFFITLIGISLLAN